MKPISKIPDFQEALKFKQQPSSSIKTGPVEDRFMALDVEPYSPSALILTDKIAILLHSQLSRRYKITAEFQRAVGTLIGDLLANAIEGVERYGYRSIGLPTFTGMAIGYKPFKAVMDAMQRPNLLEVNVGERGSLKGRTKERDATTFRAKPSLLEMALGYGLTPGNWSSHFRQMPRLARVAHPILLRSSSEVFYGHKLPGTAMKVDKALPVVQRLAEQVHDINAFMARQELNLGAYQHRYFQRIFGQGEELGRDYTKGGRLYSPGQDSYQQMPSCERTVIRINGEATVEVDIGSSFLTIYRVLTGTSFDPEADAYDIPGVPRFVAKSWVVMTFGHDRYHYKWPAKIKAKYTAQGLGSGNLQKDHPIGRTRDLILAALPELKAWPDSHIRWGELQYVESCAVVETVHTLAMRYGVPALPVHDSIRVPVSAQDLAARVLSDAFYKHVGVRPVIKAK
jgi:hypothetical protein